MMKSNVCEFLIKSSNPKITASVVPSEDKIARQRPTHKLMAWVSTSESLFKFIQSFREIISNDYLIGSLLPI